LTLESLKINASLVVGVLPIFLAKFGKNANSVISFALHFITSISISKLFHSKSFQRKISFLFLAQEVYQCKSISLHSGIFHQLQLSHLNTICQFTSGILSSHLSNVFISCSIAFFSF
jgi:hypothetical protein